MARDTGLPVIRDTEVKEKLNDAINNKWATEIRLNSQAIVKWYSSFRKIAVKKSN